MREPLDVEPEGYDLFREANRAIEEVGIIFDDDDFEIWQDEDLYDDDLSVEYVSEEDDLAEGIAFGDDDISVMSSGSEEVSPTDLPPPPPQSSSSVGETENGLPQPAVGCGSERCLVCGGR